MNKSFYRFLEVRIGWKGNEVRNISVFLVLLSAFYFLSCNRKSQDSNEKTQKNNPVLNEFDKTLENVKSLDSLYYLIDEFEQKLTRSNSVTLNTLALFYHKAGNKLYTTSKYEVSKQYFIKAEEAYLSAGDTLMSVKMRGNQAVLLDMQGHYKEAIEILLDISDYFKETNDTLPLAFAYSNIGVIYEELKNPDKAIYYGKKALRLKQLVGDTLHTANNFNNIGVNFDELLHNPDSALYYYRIASDIYKYYGKKGKYATALNNLGRMYLEKERLKEANKCFSKAYQIYDSLGYVNEKASVLSNQGELLFYEGKIGLAKGKMQEAFDIYEETGFNLGLSESSELLAKFYMTSGDYGNAANMMQFHNKIKDSLLNLENRAVIANLETKYQIKEKTKTIKMLKLQSQLNEKKIKMQYTIIAFMLVVVAFLIYFFVNRSKKAKLEQQKLRLELQNYLLQLDDMQNMLENKDDDCKKKNNLKQLDKYGLSKREMKVIGLIAEGFKNKEIAEKLFVSQNTIKTHIKNIYLKLDVKNRVEALRKMNS